MPQILDIRRHIPATSASTLTTIVAGVVVVAALYFGREILVPIALAVLLSFVLAPLVRLLQKIRVPRPFAVMVAVCLAFAIISGLAALMISQVNSLAADLPKYRFTLREKIESVRGAAVGTGTLERASDVLRELGNEIEKPKEETPTAGADRSEEPEPIPVEVREPDSGPLRTLVALVTPLIRPITTTGIVFIFVIFILLQRQDLRNRVVHLAGAHDLQRTTAALDDASRRLSRLFLTQLALNTGFGIIVGVGLTIIGVPSAPLWGLLAAILRFIPYVGAIAGAVFPIILAAAVGPGWSMVLWTAALFIVVEPLIGQGVEPFVYGQSSGLTPFAVITSAAFWTWLWGPIGLILATPLSICMVVLGRHVEGLRFLAVMFGDEAPLSPPEVLYQRMLANDPVEAIEQAEKFLKTAPLTAYYDRILLNGLRLADRDAQRGLLEDAQMERIRDVVTELTEDLGDHEDVVETSERSAKEAEETAAIATLEQSGEAAPPVVIPDKWKAAKAVLCLPGVTTLDECAVIVLAQLLERRGVGARAEDAGALTVSRIFSWDAEDVAIACLCYVEQVTPAQVRYSLRRLRRRLPQATILVALLGDQKNLDDSGFDEDPRLHIVNGDLSDTVDVVVAAVLDPENDTMAAVA